MNFLVSLLNFYTLVLLASVAGVLLVKCGTVACPYGDLIYNYLYYGTADSPLVASGVDTSHRVPWSTYQHGAHFSTVVHPDTSDRQPTPEPPVEPTNYLASGHETTLPWVPHEPAGVWFDSTAGDTTWG